jgi:hypothetical protein
MKAFLVSYDEFSWILVTEHDSLTPEQAGESVMKQMYRHMLASEAPTKPDKVEVLETFGHVISTKELAKVFSCECCE